MSFYVDTSVLVAAFTDEPAKTLAQDWLGLQAEGSLLSSDWVETEFSAALSIKIRTGQLQSVHRAAVLAGFHRLMTDSFLVLPIARVHFRMASRFANQYATGLRASDALHLALVEESGGTLMTLDHRLATAAAALGVKAQLL